MIRGIPDSKPATRQDLKVKNRQQYMKEFQKSPRYNKVIKYDPRAPTSNF